MARLRSNQDSVKNTTVKKNQIIEVVTDIRVWLIVVITFLSLCPNGLTSTFIPIVVAGMSPIFGSGVDFLTSMIADEKYYFISGLGFDSYQSVILSAPAFFVSGFSGIILGYFCVYTKNTRVIGTIITLLVRIIQNAVLLCSYGPS